MPYRKKTKYRKKPQNANATRKIVKQELGKQIETKNFFARANPTNNVQYTGTAFNLCYDPNLLVYLLQGNARNNYLGDTITPSRLRINYLCKGAGATYYNFRIVVLQVKGGGTPSPANVLQSVGNEMTPFSYKDPSYEDTFTILYDKRHTIDAAANNIATGYVSIPAKRLRKINFLAGTAANITAGGIFMVVYSDSATVNTLFGYTSCLSYKDA